MIKEIDIGHKAYSVDEALSELSFVISEAKNNNLVAVKIIHGSGGGFISRAVRDWGKSQEGRFKAIIYGENYNMFNEDAVKMRSEANETQDIDFNRTNAGITIFWL
jgi:hypothetical protein